MVIDDNMCISTSCCAAVQVAMVGIDRTREKPRKKMMVSYDGQSWNSRPAFSGLHPVTVKEKAKARFHNSSFLLDWE